MKKKKETTEMFKLIYEKKQNLSGLVFRVKGPLFSSVSDKVNCLLQDTPLPVAVPHRRSQDCVKRRGTFANVNEWSYVLKKLPLLFLNLASLEWETSTNSPISNTVSKEKPRLKYNSRIQFKTT